MRELVGLYKDLYHSNDTVEEFVFKVLNVEQDAVASGVLISDVEAIRSLLYMRYVTSSWKREISFLEYLGALSESESSLYSVFASEVRRDELIICPQIVANTIKELEDNMSLRGVFDKLDKIIDVRIVELSKTLRAEIGLDLHYKIKVAFFSQMIDKLSPYQYDIAFKEIEGFGAAAIENFRDFLKENGLYGQLSESFAELSRYYMTQLVVKALLKESHLENLQEKLQSIEISQFDVDIVIATQELIANVVVNSILLDLSKGGIEEVKKTLDDLPNKLINDAVRVRIFQLLIQETALQSKRQMLDSLRDQLNINSILPKLKEMKSFEDTLKVIEVRNGFTAKILSDSANIERSR